MYAWFEWDKGWKAFHGELPDWLPPDACLYIPHPKCLLGQQVTFDWTNGPLTGEVRRIQAEIEIPLFRFKLLMADEIPEFSTIYVTAHAGGHARWFKEGTIRKIG